MPSPKSSILETLNTSLKGLSTKEAEKRLEKEGLNILKVSKKKPWWLHFLEEFTDLMVLILIFAAGFAFFAGEEKDAIVIFTIVFINAIIGFVQKYRAEKAVEALKKLIAPTAKVIRDGEEIQIDAKFIVPGDIVVLREGDKIIADGVVIEANELKTQEATLTGESTPVQKDTYLKGEPKEKQRIFMGTLVAHGSGKALITATGMDTEFGKIATLTTETKKEKSPLQKELFKIGIFVGKVTLFISIILFTSGVVFQGESMVNALLFATAVAVAAVPEGLPATITIALAMGVQRLAKKNAIVKQLSSVETLGSTTVICSDKTGTLTKNEMTVKEIVMSTYDVTVAGVGYKPGGILTLKNNKAVFTIGNKYEDPIDMKKALNHVEKLKKKNAEAYDHLHILHRIAILCNNATLKETSKDRWEILGDPTEGALLTLGAKIGFHPERTRENHKKIYELPFDSKRKRMTVIAQDSATKKIHAYTKGAPDTLITICNKICYQGKIVDFTPKLKKEFLKKTDEMANRALRTLGMAVKELPSSKKKKYSQKEVEKDMVFYGIVGMIDPPRPEVPAAVKAAHEAGINIYVITGDHGLTATAIAKQIGIVSEKKDFQVITGQELDSLTDAQLKKLLKKKKTLDLIFARVAPEDKLRIVTLLKELHEVIAVTGDGVNDAPALKKADIGIAMGITGTDVSKEASNMVLADDSFSTIVKAIEEGRTIYENLKKFVFYIFSCNIGELTTIFAAIILGLPAPLTAILILAVDIGTDILPALALGIDPAEPGIMKKKPRDPQSKIMTLPFNSRFIFLGTSIGLIVTGTYFYELFDNGWTWGTPLSEHDPLYLKASTLAFAMLVLIQMVNAFNSRSATESVFKIGLFTNKKLLAAIMISIVTVIAFVEVPFFQKWLGTTNLSPKEWLLISVGSFAVLVIEEIRKYIVRRRLAHA